jgi:hypothetical protein
MTISDTTPRVQYAVGSGGQTAFTVSFQFFSVTDLAVYNGTSKLTYAASPSDATEYSVAGAGSSSGGTVTLGAAVASTTVTIVRDVPVARSTDFPPSGPFQINSLNDTLDKFTAMVREREDQISRSLVAPETDPTTIDLTLPVKETRATKVFAFDSAGDPVVSTQTLAEMEAGSTSAAASATSAAASAATAAAYAGTQTVDLFNGTGSQTAFTLSVAPANGDENNTDVHISGVYQQKNTYSISGTTLTFSTAPPAGTGNVEVMHMSSRAIETPADGSVTYSKFASGLVDTDLSSVSGSDDTIASAKSIKTYVDAQVTASDLDFAGGSGTGAVDLDSQTFTIAGTANEIETSASGQTITVGLPTNVTIAGVTTHGGNVVSDTDSTDSLGTTGVRWAGVWADAINGVTAPTAQYTSAEETKLAGIEASADVTDATNVTAAGALMDSELTSITAVKALNQGVATSDGPSFTDLTLSNGNLLFSSASTGVYLGVTSATAANLLDDYEEGDWTPTIGQGATASSDATYNTSFTGGQYTKVGRIVHCTATLRLTDKGTQSGAISVCGLPFASDNNVKFRATWSLWLHGASDIDLSGNTTGTIMMYQAHNSSHILMRVKDPAGTGAENVEFADISDTVYLQISGSYVAA